VGGWVAPALLGLLALPAAGAETPQAARTKEVDVVICLDVSNSMDGLIGSAKKKLWDIVNDLAKAKPSPDLRVGLYSYGNDGYDPKVGWVRKELDLTTDLDKVSQKLFGLTTNGGTEYVARVCRDAIEQQKWAEDPGALKLIFVCGNEPADQDKEVQLKDVAEKAVRKGIVINTIYCGPANHPETGGWRQFAVLSEGRFASIDQDRGTVAIPTPVDKDLADLSSQLNRTYVFYGVEARNRALNQAQQDSNATQAGLGVAAARAQSKASAVYRNEDVDLVDRLKADAQFDVKKVPPDQLSDELRKMTPEQREKYVRDMLAQREALQKKISDLGKQREEYIQNELKKNPSKADQAFDEAVRGAIREQAQKKGLAMPN
jgi:hypothetical protein